MNMGIAFPISFRIESWALIGVTLSMTKTVKKKKKNLVWMRIKLFMVTNIV